MKFLTVFVLLSSLFFALVSQSKAMGDFGYGQGMLNGKQAADFTLPTVKDQTLNLAQFSAGKRTIIFFWTTWCPHCREALRSINLRRKELQDKGIAVVLVSVGESKDIVENYLDHHQYQFDAVLDLNQSLSDSYQIEGVPTLVYLDEKRVVKSVDHGFDGDYENNF